MAKNNNGECTFEFSPEEFSKKAEIFSKEIEIFGKNFSHWEKNNFDNNSECENHLYKGYYMSVFGLVEYMYRLNLYHTEKNHENIGQILKERFSKNSDYGKVKGESFFRNYLDFTLLTLHMSLDKDDTEVTKQIVKKIFLKINVKKIRLPEKYDNDAYSISEFQNLSTYSEIKKIRNGVAHGDFVHENCSVDMVVKTTTLLAILIKNYFFLLKKDSIKELSDFFN